jgi:hypothetical protein
MDSFGEYLGANEYIQSIRNMPEMDEGLDLSTHSVDIDVKFYCS